jgi:hypothetical protein
MPPPAFHERRSACRRSWTDTNGDHSAGAIKKHLMLSRSCCHTWRMWWCSESSEKATASVFGQPRVPSARPVTAVDRRQPGCTARYERVLADAAEGGQPVVIRLRVRRFFCTNTCCPAKTFVEQVQDLTESYARRTMLLRHMLEAIGLALAGRAGARMASRLGLTASRDSLLRLVRALPDPPACESPFWGSTTSRSNAGRSTAPSCSTRRGTGRSTCCPVVTPTPPPRRGPRPCLVTN